MSSPHADDGVARQPDRRRLPDVHPTLDDQTALAAIADVLIATPDWNADTIDQIARIVAQTGRRIDEPVAATTRTGPLAPTAPGQETKT
jgi:hypothetical protein